MTAAGWCSSRGGIRGQATAIVARVRARLGPGEAFVVVFATRPREGPGGWPVLVVSGVPRDEQLAGPVAPPDPDVGPPTAMWR